MPDSNREKLTGLWASEYTDKEGKVIHYFSGSSDGVKYSIWPNGFKEKDSHPTHVLYKEVIDQAKQPPSNKDLSF